MENVERDSNPEQRGPKHTRKELIIRTKAENMKNSEEEVETTVWKPTYDELVAIMQESAPYTKIKKVVKKLRRATKKPYDFAKVKKQRKTTRKSKQINLKKAQIARRKRRRKRNKKAK